MASARPLPQGGPSEGPATDPEGPEAAPAGAMAPALAPTPSTTREQAIFVEHLTPACKLFGLTITRFSETNSDELRQQYIRKNVVNAADYPGAHVDILDDYLTDDAVHRSFDKRSENLVKWLTAFGAEKTLSSAVVTFDSLYVKLRQAAHDRHDAARFASLMGSLEKELLAFAASDSKNGWAQLLLALSAQLAEAAGYKSGLDKDKDFYFNQASLAASSDAQLHYIIGRLFLDYYDRTDTPTFLRLVVNEFEKCLMIEGARNRKELWPAITATYVDLHESFQEKDVTEPFWFEEMVYRRIIRLDPTNASAHNNLAFLYCQHGVNLKDALKEAQIANRLKPNDAHLLDTLGFALYKTKNMSQALETLKQAETLDARLADVHFHLATVYFDVDDFDSAYKQFKETIRLDPKNAFAKNNLAYLCAEKGRNLEEAKGLVDDALAKFPDNAPFIDTRGWILYKMGKYKEAQSELTRAIELMPETSDLHLHLGAVQLEMGQEEAAITSFEHALTYDPANDKLAKDLAFLFAQQALQKSLARYQRISGVNHNRENFKVFFDLLAQVYMARGDYQSAQKMLQQYTSLEIKEPLQQAPAGENEGESGEEGPAGNPAPTVIIPPLPSTGRSATTTAVDLASIASCFPAQTDLFLCVGKKAIGELGDLIAQHARTSAPFPIPSGSMLAGALDAVAMGMTFSKIPSHSCGLILLKFSPAAAAAIAPDPSRVFRMLKGSPVGQMLNEVTLSPSSYRGRVLYEVNFPQGVLYFTIDPSAVVLACSKSDIVSFVDRIGQPGHGLDQEPAFHTAMESLTGPRDVHLFLAPARFNAEGPISESLGPMIDAAQIAAAAWTLGEDKITEDSFFTPTPGKTPAVLTKVLEDTVERIKQSLGGKLAGSVRVVARFEPAAGAVRGHVEITGLAALLRELVNVMRNRGGQETPASPAPQERGN